MERKNAVVFSGQDFCYNPVTKTTEGRERSMREITVLDAIGAVQGRDFEAPLRDYVRLCPEGARLAAGPSGMRLFAWKARGWCGRRAS